ncbi:MAG: hypothetical protein JW808_10005 [Victivallales bacterium]|nr:hypothetical protein [Victivallales bacterium]
MDSGKDQDNETEKYEIPVEEVCRPSLNNVEIINKTRGLLLAGRTDEAAAIIEANWKRLTDPGTENAVEAHYLNGRICLEKASACTSKEKGAQICKQAIKSFHFILANSRSENCPFFTESVRYFKTSRDMMQNKFGIEVTFPPEF